MFRENSPLAKWPGKKAFYMVHPLASRQSELFRTKRKVLRLMLPGDRRRNIKHSASFSPSFSSSSFSFIYFPTGKVSVVIHIVVEGSWCAFRIDFITSNTFFLTWGFGLILNYVKRIKTPPCVNDSEPVLCLQLLKTIKVLVAKKGPFRTNTWIVLEQLLHLSNNKILIQHI